MPKLDLSKMYKSYYNAPTEPEQVRFEPAPYAAIDGRGDPDGTAFALSTEALYTVAYGIKAIAKPLERDFTVAKLEGLWSVDSGLPPLETPRDQWIWTLLIRLPDFVTADMLEQARLKAIAKKKELLQLRDVRFETIGEGLCVQMMHIGPYSTEPETLERMEAYMAERGLAFVGPHHEIYLSDPRKKAPAGMKTILRHPVRTARPGE